MNLNEAITVVKEEDKELLAKLRLSEISDLVEIYLRRIAHDHHKTKDGYFLVEAVWFGYEWGADKTKVKFRAVHNGYLNEIKNPIDRDTFEEAVEDLRDFLVECIADYRDEDWGWDEAESEINGTLDEGGSPLP